MLAWLHALEGVHWTIFYQSMNKQWSNSRRGQRCLKPRERTKSTWTTEIKGRPFQPSSNGSLSMELLKRRWVRSYTVESCVCLVRARLPIRNQYIMSWQLQVVQTFYHGHLLHACTVATFWPVTYPFANFDQKTSRVWLLSATLYVCGGVSNKHTGGVYAHVLVLQCHLVSRGVLNVLRSVLTVLMYYNISRWWASIRDSTSKGSWLPHPSIISHHLYHHHHL